MNHPPKTYQLVARLISEWLKDESGLLEESIRRTVANRLFAEHDVRFALNQIKSQYNETALREWHEKSGYATDKPGEVLCLHAGNLPLVGFQDVIAVLLSGNRYRGKLSRKDPWLLESFLKLVNQNHPELQSEWSIHLDDLSFESADMVLFSGSEKSVPDVKQALEKHRLIHSGSQLLIRTAHASAAWFDLENGMWDELTEAVFRYEGRGCRSVAAIFTSVPVPEFLEAFESHADAFFRNNPPIKEKSDVLRFRLAYNQAVQKPFFRAGNLIIESGEPDLHSDRVVTVIQAKPSDLLAFKNRAGGKLQTVYTNHLTQFQGEDLAQAQSPPVDWKPDGVDPLKWINDNGNISSR